MAEDRDLKPWHVAEGKTVPYGEMERDDRAQVFMQWKGTDVCLDFTCECGGDGHLHGMFAYEVQCHACGAVYAMPNTIYLVRLPEAQHGCPPLVPQP